MPLKEHIFEEDRPFAACHASTLIQLRNGHFLAAWFGGTREGHSDVAIWGAERGPDGWSPPRLLAKVRPDAHWNPVLFRDPQDRLHLYFKVGQLIQIWETWVMTSQDNGATWTRRVELETEAGEYSYPAIIALGDQVAVTYTWRRERLAFWSTIKEDLP